MIGVFDSGVGGLTVWREIVKLLPHEQLVYLADQAHVPYGRRSLEEVRALTTRCSRWLVERGCNIIVIACNTASGAALDHIRAEFPHISFVGMEPAVKPAALRTATGVIGVLATETTFKSSRYADLVSRFAGGARVRVIEQPCYGWVEFIEHGGARAHPGVGNCLTERVNTSYVTALLREGADAIVLGCTHFPFLSPVIWNEIETWIACHPGAPRINLIDPAPAVAQQTLRIYARVHARAGALPGPHADAEVASPREFWTTGRADQFSAVASDLLGSPVEAHAVHL
jgi:glutamate racemase